LHHTLSAAASQARQWHNFACNSFIFHFASRREEKNERVSNEISEYRDDDDDGNDFLLFNNCCCLNKEI